MSVKLPQIMGHRGAPSLAPENTLLGFKTAFQAGALWTETDVSLLGDGTPVIFHDATMDRCTDRSGYKGFYFHFRLLPIVMGYYGLHIYVCYVEIIVYKNKMQRVSHYE